MKTKTILELNQTERIKLLQILNYFNSQHLMVKHTEDWQAWELNRFCESLVFELN